jgi:mRNA interferase RelE/StbE
MYAIRLLDAATRELDDLDGSIRGRVIERLRWLSENLDSIKPEALTGDLAGLYKLRAGDYRVVYGILRQEQTIVVHLVGHRRAVYRRK